MTHQYIAEPTCCQGSIDYLVAAGVGRFTEAPRTKLFCTVELYERFKQQDEGEEKWLQLSAEARRARSRKAMS